MRTEEIILQGRYVRLEPLDMHHVSGLVSAAAADPLIYRWSPVPQGQDQAIQYVETALAWKEAGIAVPFAIVRLDGEMVIGSTRFFNIEHWLWPPSHPYHGRNTPDACEIGYTWLTQPAIRSAANTESKLLMLIHAFDVWQVHRVCFHTDVRNERSRAALERIGAQREGMLRAHRMAADYTVRDSMRYSIIAAEWPTVRQKLKLMIE